MADCSALQIFPNLSLAEIWEINGLRFKKFGNMLFFGNLRSPPHSSSVLSDFTDPSSVVSLGRSSRPSDWAGPQKDEAPGNHATEELQCPENFSLKQKSIATADDAQDPAWRVTRP
jgi:hypothetical protein